MNKIININLAGRLIPIDESAYDKLRDYLNRLKLFFSREEGGDEIVRDMEDRMGELFQDKLKKGQPCIMAEDIAEMISIMGSPEQIESEAGEEEPAKTQKANATADQAAAGNRMRPNHLSRSKKEKMIGGVCGGLASYFNIDPTIIRIAIILITLAWGAGLVVYLLLWAILPESDDNTPAVKRRLYRNPKQKVVGGVCSGIAAYANIDPIIPRIIFAAPLLGMIFFSIIDHGLFFIPFLTGSIPTLVLLYIILWASLPEATTVAEKLEMRGEKVDIHNLSQAIKGAETDKDAPAKRSGIAQIFAILVKVFVFFILGTVLLTLAGIIIAVLAALFGVATSSVFVFPFSGLITENLTHRYILWTCVILTLMIPFFTIIRLLVRVISGRKRAGNKWLNATLVFLFILGVFGLFWIGSSIASDFKTSYTKTFTVPLSQPANDTLIIRQMVIDDGGIVGDHDWDHDSYNQWNNDHDGIRFRDDTTVAVSNLNLHFTNSPDNEYHLLIQKSSHGRNSRRAQQFAEALEFNYRQEGNVLLLPHDFTLPKGQPFRGQKLGIEIQVPVGKVFRTEGLDNNYYTNRMFRMRNGHFSYESTDYDSWDNDEYYKMTTEGPVGKKKDKAEEDETEATQDNTDTIAR
jgi:phage shock protein PspC (stress-responsive transcriptional regulator)